MAHPTKPATNVGGSYIQDPDNSNKQIPASKGDNAYDRVFTPPTASLVKTPNAVFLAAGVGTVGFFFGSSASFASKAPEGNMHTSASHYVDYGKPAAGTRLDIHPSSWSGSLADAKAGAVIFVYKSGLSTGGR